MLIGKIKSGDQSSFRMLIDRYRHYVFKTVYAVLRNEEDAKDVTQETFIKIYYALPHYEGQGFKTWITRIAVNHAIDMRRKQLRQGEKMTQYMHEAVNLPPAATLDTPLLQSEQKERVRSRLRELPVNYREVIQAHYLEEKSYKQIAEEQHIELKTVEMRLYRARHWMRKNWKEEEF